MEKLKELLKLIRKMQRDNNLEKGEYFDGKDTAYTEIIDLIKELLK